MLNKRSTTDGVFWIDGNEFFERLDDPLTLPNHVTDDHQLNHFAKRRTSHLYHFLEGGGPFLPAKLKAIESQKALSRIELSLRSR